MKENANMSTITEVRILLVDDDEGLRNSLASSLTGRGLFVDVAANGLHAIQKLKSGFQCHIVISDIKMPGLTGIKFLSQLKAEVPNFDKPVILISGHAGPEEIKAAKAGGAVSLLVKPFTTAELMNRIQTALGFDPPGA